MKLEQIIEDPAKRKPIYQIFGLIGIILSAVQAGVAVIPDISGQPVWLTVAFAVYGVLAAAGFTVSSKNTVLPTATIDTSLPTEDLKAQIEEINHKERTGKYGANTDDTNFGEDVDLSK